MVEAGLEVADAAHTYGSEDVSRVVDEALSEVIDAAYFDVALGVDLEDAKAPGQERSGAFGSGWLHVSHSPKTDLISCEVVDD